MAKCERCGKKGLFLKVNVFGRCKECQTAVDLENELNEIRQKHEKIYEVQTARLEEITSKLNDREALFDELKAEAKKTVRDEFEMEFQSESTELIELKSQLANITSELEDKEAAVKKAEHSHLLASTKTAKLRSAYKSIEYAIEKYSRMSANDLFSIAPDLQQIEESLYPTVNLPLHCLDVKDLRKRYKDNEKLIDDALVKYQDRYTTKANAAIYQLMVIALRSELQNILRDINYGKLESSESAIKSMTAKYAKIATDGNQLIAPSVMRFIGEIEYLFLQAVNIEYEYYIRKEQIKEEQRALREQMRQEAEERKQLEQQKKQVEREENKYKLEIANVMSQIVNTEDSEKVQALKRRIEELQLQLSDVEKKKDDITRLQNGQAGYVYIISNLGSFGDNIFKIGMTRRLDPQERVDELGSASVPFPFDVHSFIFSENAVQLENSMHKILNRNRVNKVNLRKEFFRVSLNELESLVEELEPSAEFRRTMLAEQFYQSESVSYDA